MYEFFWTTEKTRIIIHDIKNNEYNPLDVDNEQIIAKVIAKLQNDYPDTYNDLLEHYQDVDIHFIQLQFSIVYRFLKCNFSIHDNTPDIDDDWNFSFELVSCPLRGECDLGFCNPKLTSKLTDREKDVVKLKVEALTEIEIGDRLYISPRTVHNHVSNIYKKLGFTGKSNPDKLLITYAFKNKIVN